MENEIFLGGHIIRNYKEKYKNKIETVQIELPYRFYIENRDFKDEEIYSYEDETFNKAQSILKDIFENILKQASCLK